MPSLRGNPGVVLFASFLGTILVGWNFLCFGILLVPLLQEFELGEGTTSLIGSANYMAFVFSALFVGKLVDGYGSSKVSLVGAFVTSFGLLVSAFAKEFWQLIITYGIITGIGFQFGYSAVVGIVPRYFDKNRGIAVGITEAGFGVGGLVFPFYMDATIKRLGYRTYFMVSAGITFAVFIVCWISFKAPKESHGVDAQESTVGNRKYNTPAQICLSLTMLFVSFGYFTPFSFAVELGRERGIPVNESGILISMFGLGSMVGLAVFGVAVTKLNIRPRALFISILLISGLLTMLNKFYTTFAGLCVYFVLYGLFMDSIFLPLQLLCVEHMGIEYIAQSFGIAFGAQAPGAVIGPPIAGWIKEKTGSYIVAYTVSGAFICFGAVFLFILPKVSRKTSGNTRTGDLNMLIRSKSVYHLSIPQSTRISPVNKDRLSSVSEDTHEAVPLQVESLGGIEKPVGSKAVAIKPVVVELSKSKNDSDET